MDIVPILSTIILVSTLATLVLAVVSYMAFKLRDRRKPATRKAVPATGPQKTFFVRYQPPGAAARPGAAG